MEIKDILEKNEFRFKKSLGQNFISDKNLLGAIVSDAEITKDDVVVEIGTGAGTLTAAIADKAKKVYTFEVDRRLSPILKETLQDYDNIEVVFQDVLKMKDEDFLSLIKTPFKLVANLPYYITTPLMMHFIEKDLGASSVTVTVQKEVADRIAGKPGTEDYGAITAQIDLRGTARVTRDIPRKMFYPVPNVDSAVLRIDIEKDKFVGADIAAVSKLIKVSFAMRRKTLLNNLSAAYPYSKDVLKEMILSIFQNENMRGETLSTTQFIKLAEGLKQLAESH